MYVLILLMISFVGLFIFSVATGLDLRDYISEGSIFYQDVLFYVNDDLKFKILEKTLISSQQETSLPEEVKNSNFWLYIGAGVVASTVFFIGLYYTGHLVWPFNPGNGGGAFPIGGGQGAIINNVEPAQVVAGAILAGIVRNHNYVWSNGYGTLDTIEVLPMWAPCVSVTIMVTFVYLLQPTKTFTTMVEPATKRATVESHDIQAMVESANIEGAVASTEDKSSAVRSIPFTHEIYAGGTDFLILNRKIRELEVEVLRLVAYPKYSLEVEKLTNSSTIIKPSEDCIKHFNIISQHENFLRILKKIQDKIEIDVIVDEFEIFVLSNVMIQKIHCNVLEYIYGTIKKANVAHKSGSDLDKIKRLQDYDIKKEEKVQLRLLLEVFWDFILNFSIFSTEKIAQLKDELVIKKIELLEQAKKVCIRELSEQESALKRAEVRMSRDFIENIRVHISKSNRKRLVLDKDLSFLYIFLEKISGNSEENFHLEEVIQKFSNEEIDVEIARLNESLNALLYEYKLSEDSSLAVLAFRKMKLDEFKANETKLKDDPIRAKFTREELEAQLGDIIEGYHAYAHKEFLDNSVRDKRKYELVNELRILKKIQGLRKKVGI